MQAWITLVSSRCQATLTSICEYLTRGEKSSKCTVERLL
jgi:hypothetical protein